MNSPENQVAPSPLSVTSGFGNVYSEGTLKTSGWYFFYPAHPRKYERPKFVELSQDTIDDGDLHCRMGEGTYIGPIIPPALPNDTYQPTPGNGAAKQGEHPK